MDYSNIPSDEVQQLHLEVALSLGEQLRVIVEMMDSRLAPLTDGAAFLRADLAALRAELAALRDVDSRHDEALRSGSWLTEDGFDARCKLDEVRGALCRLEASHAAVIEANKTAIEGVEAKVTPVYRIAVVLGVAWGALVALLLLLTAAGRFAGLLTDAL